MAKKIASEEIVLRIPTQRDVGRILSGLRSRRRKLQKGIDKFGEAFDPELGKNMLEGVASYDNLIHSIEGQIA